VLSADVRFTVAQKHFAVNLQLKEGLYLVMGPNGAGKTTFYVYCWVYSLLKAQLTWTSPLDTFHNTTSH